MCNPFSSVICLVKYIEKKKKPHNQKLEEEKKLI